MSVCQYVRRPQKAAEGGFSDRGKAAEGGFSASMKKLVKHFFLIHFLGCIRRTSDSVTEDYDEIDRKFPPLFINNTRTKIVVASGKTATLECRVQNLEERTVSF